MLLYAPRRGVILVENDILKLIYDYSIDGKIADLNFVESLIDIVSDSRQLHDYIKALECDEKRVITDSGKLRLANYDVISRVMKVNISSVKKYLANFVNRYGDRFSYFEQLFLGNTVTTCAILHEMEHCEQNKKYHYPTKNTESVLIEMGFRASYLSEKLKKSYIELINKGYTPKQLATVVSNEIDLRRKYYDYSPVERLADIRSYNMLSAVLAPINDEVPNLYDYYCFNYMNKLISGYEKKNNILIYPVYTYMKGMGYERDWQKFNFHDIDPQVMSDKLFSQHSLIERLSFGLPVTFDEYDSVSKVLTKYKRFF